MCSYGVCSIWHLKRSTFEKNITESNVASYKVKGQIYFTGQRSSSVAVTIKVNHSHLRNGKRVDDRFYSNTGNAFLWYQNETGVLTVISYKIAPVTKKIKRWCFIMNIPKFFKHFEMGINDDLNTHWSLKELDSIHHHHHIALVAWISLTLSRHSSLSFIALGRSSGQHTVSSHSCWMYVRAGRPAFTRPCVGVHKSTSLMSSSLLLQQCPACLVRLTWIVFVIGGRWPYSWCLVGCCC